MDALGRITARAPAAGCLGTADTESDRSTTPAGEESANCSPAPTPLQGFSIAQTRFVAIGHFDLWKSPDIHQIRFSDESVDIHKH